MPSNSSIVSAIHHLKIADEYFADFQRQYPKSIAARLFIEYRKKIEWIYKSFVSHPVFIDSPEVCEGVRKEWNSDVLAMPAITEKVALLRPEQREALENVIDCLLKGESLKVEHIPG